MSREPHSVTLGHRHDPLSLCTGQLKDRAVQEDLGMMTVVKVRVLLDARQYHTVLICCLDVASR
jgi:hypothetical protein